MSSSTSANRFSWSPYTSRSEWKADLLHNLTNEIAQIHKADDNAIEAQREEIERQREQFAFEIEVLRKRILDLEMEKGKTTQGQTRKV